jgi:hypothetical protein
MTENTQKHHISTPEIVHATLEKTLTLCQGPQFPRTISAFKTKGRQVEVSNTDEIIEYFQASDFVDCRINAYPKVTNYDGINLQAPTLIMCDIDFVKFRTERLLLQTLDRTLDNIQKDIDGIPMVLFTGNGYHVYQPIKLPILEEESIFVQFDNPSTEFIRYAAQKWTEGKNDPANHPSVNSCLLRIPGSTNSKNLKMVELVQEWNGVAPAANRMLSNFYIKLAAQKIAHRSKQREYYFQRKYMTKNYDHFGSRTTVDFTTNAIDGIAWINDLLAGDGIADYRKLMVDLVLAPYLVNIKQCDYNTAFSKIIEWLDKCGRKKRLSFRASYKVGYALRRSLKTGIRPMRLDTMKNNYGDMYNEIFSGARD